jgi:hypothetical protein
VNPVRNLAITNQFSKWALSTSKIRMTVDCGNIKNSTLLPTLRLLFHPVGAASLTGAKHAPFRNYMENKKD